MLKKSADMPILVLRQKVKLFSKYFFCFDLGTETSLLRMVVLVSGVSGRTKNEIRVNPVSETKTRPRRKKSSSNWIFNHWGKHQLLRTWIIFGELINHQLWSVNVGIGDLEAKVISLKNEQKCASPTWTDIVHTFHYKMGRF